ncbi:hypothetical protein ACFQX4_26720 [Roseomonas sp. GCM10028921]
METVQSWAIRQQENAGITVLIGPSGLDLSTVENRPECNWLLSNSFPEARTGTRQGARRLSLGDVRQLVNAHAYATALGRPLNAHLIVHLVNARGFTAENGSAWRSHFLDKLHRHLHRTGTPPAYLWVRETAARKGPHLHVLLHLHNWTAQRAPLIAYVLRTAFPPEAAALTHPHAPVRITGGRFGMGTDRMRAGVLRYVCKGIDPCATYRLRGDGRDQTVIVSDVIGVEPSDAPPLPGQRYGASHSLGPAARRAAGWQEMHDLNDLARHLNPPRTKGTR